MIIYALLTSDCWNEGYTIVGLYDFRGLAQAELEKQKLSKHMGSYEGYAIEEFRLNWLGPL